MTNPSEQPLPVDTRVTRVLEVLMAYKRESWNELVLATGIAKHTLIRRRSHGGWSAAEVERLAEHFGQPVAKFYAGPDALFFDGSSTTRALDNGRYLGVTDVFPMAG